MLSEISYTEKDKYHIAYMWNRDQALPQGKPPQQEACTQQRRVAPVRHNQRKPACHKKDPVQSKTD